MILTIIITILIMVGISYFIKIKKKNKESIQVEKPNDKENIQVEKSNDKEVIYTSSQIEEIQREFNTNKYNSRQIENILKLVNKKVPFELIKLVLDPNVNLFMIFNIYYHYDDLQLIGIKEILSELEKGIYDSEDKFENKATIFIANKKLQDLKKSN